MRRLPPGVLLFILLLCLSGCSRNAEATVVNTFEETKDGVMTTYYEMSDGTWKTDDYTYRYRLVITGRLHNAVKDTTYTILSNIEDITFEQAWKASGLSSNSTDYFEIEDAVFVAIK